MKIELRKLAIYPRLSQETTAFAADLWIDGAKVGHARNDGRGGMSFVDWCVPPARRAEIEIALKALVPTEYQFTGGVEWSVGEIVEAKRAEKETAKNDTNFKRRSAKYGTGAARFVVSDASGKSTIWVEYGKGGEEIARAQMQQKHATIENWTVLA